MNTHARVQTEVVVDGLSFVLAPEEDLDEVQDGLQDAIAQSGRFVPLALAGRRHARARVGPGSRLAMITEEVEDDGVLAAMSLNDEGNWDLL